MDKSHVVLIFISQGYFSSPNCMRELLRAVYDKKRIVNMMETEAKHGGMTREQVRAHLGEATTMYEKWGLAAEMVQWGFPQPSSVDLYFELFATHEPIEWNRIGLFRVLQRGPLKPRHLRESVYLDARCDLMIVCEQRM